MIRRDYLIVGAGIGGATVCEGIRAHDKKGTIMMVGNETFLPYHRPRLFKSYLGKSMAQFEKVQHLDAEWFEKNKIDLRLDTLVTHFNHERHLAVLGNGQAVEFRKACLATGSHAHRPHLAVAHLGNVFYLRSIRDVMAVREIAATERIVVVIGGGFVAAETAALLSQLPKAQVTLMHRGRFLWNRFLDEETAAWLTDYYARHGVKMLMGETLNGFEGRTVLRNVQTKSGQRLPAGMAIVAVGAEVNLGLVAGTPLAYPKGTPVNEYLETDEKGIYAVGDIALYPDRIFGGVRRIDHWEAAVAQGRVAGANMSGKKRIKFEFMPYHTSLVFDLNFEFGGDMSRPPGRVEFEGDRAKKKFVARYFHLQTLTGVVLCNQPPEKVEAAKKQVREWPREVKKVVL
jgi:3-phenylpropionate/trans-cinnamate dioxygenase ferredoxin reductase subunit